MSKALYADRYCLRMGQFWWRHEMDDRVTYELFVRSLPATRGYLVVAGLGTALWYLRNFRFEREDIAHLRTVRTAKGHSIYDVGYLDALRKLDFTCDVWAIPEGTPVGAHTPIMRITGPRIQSTLIESALLATNNHQTMIASKVARLITSSGGRMVWDFSLRRLHGMEASLGVARAAYIAGAEGTATEEAVRVLGIPGTGTMAHAQVMTFGEDQEQTVFEMVMRDAPEDHVLLVDTYDTRRGIQRAIAASLNTGLPLNGVRDDSDLVKSVPILRDHLDAAALAQPNLFDKTKIVASNDLDEWKMDELRNLAVDAYGVGTMLGTSADAPHLGGVYKLTKQHERDPEDVMKLTRGKQTDPGVHQVWRCYSNDGSALYDVLALVDETLSEIAKTRAYGGEFKPLLTKVMEAGRVVQPTPTLDESRVYHAQEKVRMPAGVLKHDNPDDWNLFRTNRLWALRAELGDEDAAQEMYRIEQEKKR